MPSPAAAEKLKPLLLEFLTTALGELQDPREPSATIVAGDKTFSAERDSPARAAILERILDVLGPKFEIPDPRELEGLIVTRLAERIKLTVPSGSVDETLAALIDDIRHPVREYLFSTRCSGFGEMAYNVEFSGSPLLRLVATQADSSPSSLWSHRIDGRVRAWTHEHAVARAETVLEEFLGACMTLGMTSTFRAPRTVALAQLEVSIEPEPPEGPLYLDVGLSALTGATVFLLPRSLSDLEERARQRKDYRAATARVVATLACVFSETGPAADSLRTSLRFFCRGMSAREYGLAVFNWFTALEGLLLESESTSDVQARLVEAVTFSLGTGAPDRTALRKLLKQLYKDRSGFVHRGYATEQRGMREKCGELTSRVLLREMQSLRRSQ